MNKKGDLSIEMIVKVVIALLVLFFVFFLVSKSFNSAKSLNECTEPDRKCSDVSPGDNYIRYYPGDKSCQNNQVCWQKISD